MLAKTGLLLCVAAALSWAAVGVVTQQGEALAGPRSAASSTGLLFPFAFAGGGFDTEIAISNTSLDTLGSSPQAGVCTLY